MANQTTPESEKTVSRNIEEVPSLGLDGPTPKTDKKALVDQQRLVCQYNISYNYFLFHRHVFMSPTDAMTSPCTQKLINLHRYPRRQTRSVCVHIMHFILNNNHQYHPIT